jgi:hypothetical protein
MPSIKPPSRAELSKFLPTQELIRAFEQLWGAIGDDTTDLSEVIQQIQDAVIANAATDAKADEAVSAISRLADAITMAALTPDNGKLAKSCLPLAVRPNGNHGNGQQRGNLQLTGGQQRIQCCYFR